MIKAFFFDLDGTLLPIDEKVFVEQYFSLLVKKVSPLGYEPKRLMETIWKGTEAMYKNDGSKTNYQAFWDYFASIYGQEKLKDIPFFNEFYVTDFKKLKDFISPNPYAKDIVKKARELTGKVVLATNPIFPMQATETRMEFIGFNKEDFSYVTAYENFSYSKPNPMYFIQLLKMFSLKPEEVIMFGNNPYEDGECALNAGIKTYLVGDFIIKGTKATHEFKHIEMSDVIKTMEEEISSSI